MATQPNTGRKTVQVPGYDPSAAAEGAPETVGGAPSAESILSKGVSFREAVEAAKAGRGQQAGEQEPVLHERGESELPSSTPDVPELEQRPENNPTPAPSPQAERGETPPAAPKAPRLTRKQIREMKEAQAELNDIRDAALADPEIAVRYARQLTARGKVVPPSLAEYVARVTAQSPVAAAAGQAPQKNEPPALLTDEQIEAKFNEILKTGKIGAAYDWRTEQRMMKYIRRMEELERVVKAGEEDRQTRAQQQQQQQLERQTQEGMQALAKSHTDFFEVRDGIARFKDTDEAMELYDMMQELDATYQNSVPVDKLAKLAMFELGWLARKPQAAGQPTAPAAPRQQRTQTRQPANPERPKSTPVDQRQDNGQNPHAEVRRRQGNRGLWNLRIPVYDTRAR